MKNIYTIVLLFLTISVNSQTTTVNTVNFDTNEGYTAGALYNQTGWDSQFTGNTWIVDPVSGVSSVSSDFQMAAWKQGFSVSEVNDYVTFRVDLKFTGTFGTNNNPLIKIGFSSSSDVAAAPPPPNNGVFLRTANYNTQLQLGNNLNSGALTPNASLVIADCQGIGESDDLAVIVTLTLGADASSSTISAKLMNLTDGTETVVGSQNGVSSEVFGAATTNIYGFFQAQSFKNTGGSGALTEIQVSSVTMTEVKTLSVKSYALPTFDLSQNPVKDEVQLSGLIEGSRISIYSVTGAKASSHVFNGSSLNLSHLNTGVYFMETPGFAVKKIIKK